MGQDFEIWVRDTFTDWDKLTEGEIICEACQFCFSDRNDQLTALTGKRKFQRMRNYSHFVASGEWIPLSKGSKARMLELLMAAPELAIIAISGQKHIIFRAQAGWWQIEESKYRPFPRDLERCLAVVGEMYAGGFSKAEIAAGRYAQHRIITFGVERWSDCERMVRTMRGTPAFELACFLVQYEEND